MKSLLTVSVFTILAVSSVECYNCVNSQCLNGHCVDTLAKTCAASHGCLNQVQEFKDPDESKNIMFYQKSCPADTCSPLSFSATLGGQRTFRFDQQCCQTEECNKQNLQLPQLATQNNGVQCPACYSETGLLCTTTSIQCKGAETKCVEVIGTATVAGTTVSHLSLYGQGCATENACGLHTTLVDGITIRAFCTSGSPPLKSIAPALISLFLLTVLL